MRGICRKELKGDPEADGNRCGGISASLNYSEHIFPRIVETRTEVFDTQGVKGSEFLRRVKAAAQRKKLPYEWVRERGVGSHGTLYLGGRFTVVKDLKKELGPGLLSAMCKQLGVRKEDL
jgi:predicted RNA binding protein YcfA (HicA-like mRNA interferase family)